MFKIGDRVIIKGDFVAPPLKNDRGKAIKILFNRYFNENMIMVQFEYNYATWLWEKDLGHTTVLYA